MSNAVFYLRNARWGLGTGNTELVDALTGGTVPLPAPGDVSAAITWAPLPRTSPRTLHITREEQDAFSLASQRRAVAAIDAGKFKDEIVPVEVPQGRKKPPIVFDTDEFPRRDTSEEKMAKLKPCFNITQRRPGPAVTALPSSPAPCTAGLLLRTQRRRLRRAAHDRGKGQGAGPASPLARIIGHGHRRLRSPHRWALAPFTPCPRRWRTPG